MGERDSADAGGSQPAPGDSILDAVQDAFEPRPPAYSRTRGTSPQDQGVRRGGEASPLLPRRDPAARPRFGRRPSLFGHSAEERRARLSELAATGVEPGHLQAIAHVLTTDPDPAIRVGAARLLAETPLRVPLTLLARALGDPDDGVRSAVVRLALPLGGDALPLVLPLVTQRRWPATQLAALEMAPRLVRPGVAAPSDADLDRLADSVGRLDPPPLPLERPGLEALSRAVGPSRLARWFGAADPARLGAARLANRAVPGRTVAGLRER